MLQWKLKGTWVFSRASVASAMMVCAKTITTNRNSIRSSHAHISQWKWYLYGFLWLHNKNNIYVHIEQRAAWCAEHAPHAMCCVCTLHITHPRSWYTNIFTDLGVLFLPFSFYHRRVQHLVLRLIYIHTFFHVALTSFTTSQDPWTWTDGASVRSIYATWRLPVCNEFSRILIEFEPEKSRMSWQKIIAKICVSIHKFRIVRISNLIQC